MTELGRELLAKADDARRFRNVPCQTDSDWHADDYTRWAEMAAGLTQQRDALQAENARLAAELDRAVEARMVLGNDLQAKQFAAEAQRDALQAEVDEWRSRFGLKLSTGWQSAADAAAIQQQVYEAGGQRLKDVRAQRDELLAALRDLEKVTRFRTKYHIEIPADEWQEMMEQAEAAIARADASRPQEPV